MSGPSSSPRLPALRYYPDFRLLWIAEILAGIGSEMQLIAVNWHVFALLRGQVFTINLLGQPVDLSAEALGLGSLGLVRIIPIVILALLGGILADTQDRRKVLIGTQIASGLLAAILAGLTLGGQDSIPAIYLLTASGAAISAFAGPARQATVPNLVGEKHLSNAISLNTLQWQITAVVGPAVAGLLVARFDVGIVYLVSAVLLSIPVVLLFMMRFRGHVAERDAGLGWQALLEGVRYTYHERIIWGTMLLDFFATFFASARTMLPIVATSMLGLGPEGYGLLATAQPVGALLAGAVLALRREIDRQGVVLLISVVVYGVATALFGLSTTFFLSYFFFALTGAGDTVSTVIRGTIRQLRTPDRLRGRMTSVNMIFFTGGPQLGELEAGLVAAAFGAPAAIVSGGILTVLLTGWIAWKYPRLREYTRLTMQEQPAQAAVAAADR